MDLSEEDQMVRAIAMSLGENILSAAAEQSEGKSKEEEEKKKAEAEQQADKQQEEEPLDKDIIDTFTSQMLDGIYALMILTIGDI